MAVVSPTTNPLRIIKEYERFLKNFRNANVRMELSIVVKLMTASSEAR